MRSARSGAVTFQLRVFHYALQNGRPFDLGGGLGGLTPRQRRRTRKKLRRADHRGHLDRRAPERVFL